MNFMRSETYINSGNNDRITIIASASKNIPGHIRIWSGNFVKEKQFRYGKCEMFTASIQKNKPFQVYMEDVKIHYSYLFVRASSVPVQRICLHDSQEKPCGTVFEFDREKSCGGVSEITYRNQNYFHFTAPVGWLNDPVGLCFYRGLYHMFYQFNPASQQWGDAYWGHVTSRDLLHWREHPVVLSPQPEIICNPLVRGGAYSGTALIEQDKMHLFFTRHIGDLEKQHCMEYTATVNSKDGFTFSGERRAVDALPVELGENFRDPKVWREGDEWLMLTGTETKDGAAVSVHSSKDLVEWEYKGIFHQEEERRYLRAECPSILKIGEKYVLIVGYHNRERTEVRRDTVYYIGSVKDYKFHAQGKGLLDYGKDFYAAQVFANLDRPTLIAWVNDRYAYHIDKLCRSNGTMSLPRRLWIQEGELYSFPADEVEAVETEESRFGYAFYMKDGRGHLHIDLADNSSGQMILAGSEAGQVSITVCSNRTMIDFDGDRWDAGIYVQELDVYTDNALLEIFLNHGRRAFTRRYERYETDYEVRVKLSEGCKAIWTRISM